MRAGRSYRKTLMMAMALGMALLPSALSHAAPSGETQRVVTIAARRFEFVPNEITLKQGETVTLRLTTEDVTHGFYLKALGIDAVIKPGQSTEITLTPQGTGTFTLICDHYCGHGHGGMHLKVVVV